MQIDFIQEWEARSVGIFRDQATPMPYLSNHTQSKLSQQTNPRTFFYFCWKHWPFCLCNLLVWLSCDRTVLFMSLFIKGYYPKFQELLSHLKTVYDKPRNTLVSPAWINRCFGASGVVHGKKEHGRIQSKHIHTRMWSPKNGDFQGSGHLYLCLCYVWQQALSNGSVRLLLE